MSSKRWLVKTSHNEEEINELRSALKIDPIVAELLLQRNIDSFEAAELFFRPQWSQLHDPLLMKDLPAAVDRINTAISKGEKILLFGDYDVDGTTAVTLLHTLLKPHYAAIDFYIPDRYTEGYGISIQGIDFAKENNFSVIIALDCGVRSIEHIAYAKELGIDFIVCDHHQPGDVLPDCLVLDPKREDCTYPYKELSGCGVGFKLMQGLFLENQWNENELQDCLDLLALSIGADIVPVTGENRVLAYFGMLQLNAKPRFAFQYMIETAKRIFPLTLTDVVFTIAPRINAAGRIRSGKYAVELMISADKEEIKNLVAEIEEDNLLRRELDKEITEEALAMIDNDVHFLDKKSTVVFKNDWHKGVVGIVASRLIEKHYRPTIVLTESNGKATGSARSVNNFDLYNSLVECEHLLDQFGGHTHAAGLTLSLDNIDAFVQQFETVVAKNLNKEDQTAEQVIDAELSLDELYLSDQNRTQLPRIKRILDQFEPFGPGNMKPVFMAKNVYAIETRLLKDAHLKLRMTQPNSTVAVDGIGFNLADKQEFVASGLPFDITFTLESNTWKDKTTLQLNIKDIRSTI
ncbi:MAG: single-stranded-DNA-specific exonuclease RecJ [Bacteroidota bacterium]